MADQSQLEPYKAKQYLEFFKRHRISRRLANMMLFSTVIAYFILTKEGRRLFTQYPEIRKFLIDKEARIGLLEQAILFPVLYVPNGEKLMKG